MKSMDHNMYGLIIDFEEKLGRKVNEKERIFLQWVTAKAREQNELNFIQQCDN
ncbi:hypothetical protein [Shouchella miscanthi]|uniref:hypothetical protein n=1 Tax=Shouchella miscanthi TaxID=2598861 RepID=UPI00164381FC|nr:hypothetical protein [Shouchella miscanthi]